MTGNGQDGAAHPVYRPRSIKRFRRTKAAVGEVRDAIFDVLIEANPQTVRQVFYALTVRGVIKKAESEYKQTVIRLLTEMREAGEIPFDWIADNTRWMRKPTTYTGARCLPQKHFELLPAGPVGGDAGLCRSLV
jgi:hypothetical protein